MMRSYGTYYKNNFTKFVFYIDKTNGNDKIILGGLYEQN